MKLLSTILLGSALAQERLDAQTQACATFRDLQTSNNPIHNGQWNCKKITKGYAKKATCTAACTSGFLKNFKKATLSVKCGDPPKLGKLKKKPKDAALACFDPNACDHAAENLLITDGSLSMDKKAGDMPQIIRYYLKCSGDKKPRKELITCDTNTGMFMSEELPDYKTVCDKNVMVESYYCDMDSGATSSGNLVGKIFIEPYWTELTKGVMFRGTIGSTAITGTSPDLDFDLGRHGIHVHELITPLDDPMPTDPDKSTCYGLGGHFKGGVTEVHGESTAWLPNRHAGDIGEVYAFAYDQGSHHAANVKIMDKIVSLDPMSALFIGDRSLVVHSNPDDGNPFRDPTSTGSAGHRPGCCIIKPIQYTCDFATGPGSGAVVGSVTLKYKNGKVVIDGTLTGLSDGMKGFHVHQFGLLTNACADSGPHFESDSEETHGASTRSLPDRHAGDLGNIVSSGMSSTVAITDEVVSLISDDFTYIGGRAMVIHDAMDDGNPFGLPDSTADGMNTNGAGNAGARVACCVITAV